MMIDFKKLFANLWKTNKRQTNFTNMKIIINVTEIKRNHYDK